MARRRVSAHVQRDDVAVAVVHVGGGLPTNVRARGVAGRTGPGPYQLQAAIAATHADAATAEKTKLAAGAPVYLILERIAPDPMVTLNRAIALAETEGPLAGLALLSSLGSDERTAGHHRLLSVQAHLLEKTGDTAVAYEHYRRGAKSTASIA
ncbi:MAG TPA: hypothetical protein VLM11_03650 [Streptosporangiaceae bacterium]|nr:hypothetical protein [Streptosporangiaceae bacterium]